MYKFIPEHSLTWQLNNKCTWACFKRVRIDGEMGGRIPWEPLESGITLITPDYKSLATQDNTLYIALEGTGTQTMSKYIQIWVKDFKIEDKELDMHEYAVEMITRTSAPYHRKQLELLDGIYKIVTSINTLMMQTEGWVTLCKEY